MSRRYLTSCLFYVKFAKRNPLVFMIDSGSERNLIKRGLVNAVINRNQNIKFTGISEGHVEAVGTIDVCLRGLNSSKEFHQIFYVVTENFQLEVDGTLRNKIIAHSRKSLFLSILELYKNLLMHMRSIIKN